MSTIKDVLIKKVKNYKIGDVHSNDAQRLRTGMIDFIQKHTIDQIEEILDIYCQDFYELMEFDNYEDITSTTKIMDFFKAVKLHLGPSADAIYETQTAFFLKKYEEHEPLFVSIIDAVYNIVNTDDRDEEYMNSLIGDICFFIESLSATIEESGD